MAVLSSADEPPAPHVPVIGRHLPRVRVERDAKDARIDQCRRYEGGHVEWEVVLQCAYDFGAQDRDGEEDESRIRVQG